MNGLLEWFTGNLPAISTVVGWTLLTFGAACKYGRQTVRAVTEAQVQNTAEHKAFALELKTVGKRLDSHASDIKDHAKQLARIGG